MEPYPNPSTQVKVIMDQARYDAEQLRVEASRMRDASANQVGWLEGELDNATREVEVLRVSVPA